MTKCVSDKGLELLSTASAGRQNEVRLSGIENKFISIFVKTLTNSVFLFWLNSLNLSAVPTSSRISRAWQAFQGYEKQKTERFTSLSLCQTLVPRDQVFPLIVVYGLLLLLKISRNSQLESDVSGLP